MSLSLFAAPAAEPLTLSEVKAHLRIDTTDEDAYLTTLITVARMRCEGATRRALITQTWDWVIDRWPTWEGYHGGQTFEPAYTSLPAGGFVWLPKPPLQSVAFVHYVDL